MSEMHNPLYSAEVPAQSSTVVVGKPHSWGSISSISGTLFGKFIFFGGWTVGLGALIVLGAWVDRTYLNPPLKPQDFVSEGGLTLPEAKRFFQHINQCRTDHQSPDLCRESSIGETVARDVELKKSRSVVKIADNHVVNFPPTGDAAMNPVEPN